jgi:hypothetical protein
MLLKYSFLFLCTNTASDFVPLIVHTFRILFVIWRSLYDSYSFMFDCKVHTRPVVAVVAALLLLIIN